MQALSLLSDKFSWKRTLSVGLIYKRNIRFHLIIAATLSILSALISQITTFGDPLRLSFVMVSSSVLALFTYMSPLVFAKRDNTLLGLLPAKPIEKWSF